jgi:cell division protein FtsB
VQSSSQGHTKKSHTSSRSEGNNANVTSAIGMEESAGRLRAKRSSLFTQTVLWVTALICIAFLLGSFTQAWSNNQLIQKVQLAQQQLERTQAEHNRLVQTAHHYKDPSVIENEARQQLGYIRPGEHLLVVVNSNDQSQQNVHKQATVEGKQSFWQEWWHTFFGN